VGPGGDGAAWCGCASPELAPERFPLPFFPERFALGFRAFQSGHRPTIFQLGAFKRPALAQYIRSGRKCPCFDIQAVASTHRLEAYCSNRQSAFLAIDQLIFRLPRPWLSHAKLWVNISLRSEPCLERGKDQAPRACAQKRLELRLGQQHTRYMYALCLVHQTKTHHNSSSANQPCANLESKSAGQWLKRLV